MAQLRTAAIVFGCLAAVNCGGGSGGYSAPPPTSPTPPPTSTNAVTISIVGVRGKLSFSPNPASVTSGQMVVFKNNDVVPHRVILDDGTMATGEIAPGATSQELPLGAINKAYHCSIHPSMVGSLNAADTPDPPPCTGYCG
jgi:plastocyanin